MTNSTGQVDIIDKSILRTFAKIVIDLSVTIEYIKNINISPNISPNMPPKYIPPTYDQNKILWITEGEIGFLYDLINGLNRSNIYIDNGKCYIDRLSFFLNLMNYHQFLRGELKDLEPIVPGTLPIISWVEQMKKLIEFFEETHPFNLIYTKRVMKIDDMEKLLEEYCKNYREKHTNEEYPNIRDIKTEKLIEFFDDVLWEDTGRNIIYTFNMILETNENMWTHIGLLDCFILFITTLKDNGYPVKDYVIEGKNLLINLKDALDVKLDIDQGIERNKKDLEKLNTAMDLIKNAYPLNKIITGELSGDYVSKLLQDFLLGRQIITPEMLIPPKEFITTTHIFKLKEILDKVLEENSNAKVTVDLSIYETENILGSSQYNLRYGIENSKEASVYTTLFYSIITDDLDISFIPYAYDPNPESVAKNRILSGIYLEPYKKVLKNIIKENPYSIIGDIIIEDTKDLKELIDILVEHSLHYDVKIDILQKDQDKIKESYKNIPEIEDVSKIIFKSSIKSVEISEFYKIGYDHRILLLHLGDIRKV